MHFNGYRELMKRVFQDAKPVASINRPELHRQKLHTGTIRRLQRMCQEAAERAGTSTNAAAWHFIADLESRRAHLTSELRRKVKR